MSYLIKDDHRLYGEDVEQIACGKQSGEFADKLPDTVIIHYTAGGSLKSAVDTLMDPNVRASAHLVIGRQGEIRQLIPFNVVAWHAGKSKYKDRSGMNQYSIGIEIDNAGRLDKAGDTFVSWFGRKYPADQVKEAVHRHEAKTSYWHVYTEEQITRVFSITGLLREKYGIRHILGHEEIAPGRKFDPGPAFPLDRLRQKLLEEDRSLTLAADTALRIDREIASSAARKGIVRASLLNFRERPSMSGDVISDPLVKGTSLEVLDEENGWLKVKVARTGWVKKEFVQMA